MDDQIREEGYKTLLALSKRQTLCKDRSKLNMHWKDSKEKS